MLLLFALLLPVLLAFAAFVIDIGHAFVLKRHLQGSADAAALAAAQDLPEHVTAVATAHAYSAESGGLNEREGLAGVTTTVEFPQTQTVRVKQTATSQGFFAKILPGFDGITVSATAAATNPSQTSGDKHLVFAHSSTCDRGVTLTGRNLVIDGAVRSNGRLDIPGDNIAISSASGYGPENCTPVVSGRQGTTEPNSVDDIERNNELVQWPFYWSFSGDGDGQYGEPYTPFPPDYCTFRAAKFDFNQRDVTIPPGVYCATEEFVIRGDGTRGEITVLAPKIEIRAGTNFKYFDQDRQLLFFLTKVAPPSDVPPIGTCPSPRPSMSLQMDSLTLEGIMFNPCGLVEVEGNSSSFVKGYLIGESVRVAGDGFHLEGIELPGAGGGEAGGIALVE